MLEWTHWRLARVCKSGDVQSRGQAGYSPGRVNLSLILFGTVPHIREVCVLRDSVQVSVNSARDTVRESFMGKLIPCKRLPDPGSNDDLGMAQPYVSGPEHQSSSSHVPRYCARSIHVGADGKRTVREGSRYSTYPRGMKLVPRFLKVIWLCFSSSS